MQEKTVLMCGTPLCPAGHLPHKGGDQIDDTPNPPAHDAV
jgi:hypothetical protein